MKRILNPVVILFVFLLAACSSSPRGPYAIFAPFSPIYEKLEIAVQQGGEDAQTELTLAFTATNGNVLGLIVRAQDGELTLAQDLNLVGIEAGANLTAEILREILVTNEIVSAAQFKVQDGERVLELVRQLAKPGISSIEVPPAYQLLETNIGAAGSGG